MRHHIDKDNITAVARKVLLLMSQHQISLYPENYLVWFDYVIGVSKELETDISRIIHNGKTFSDEINDDLYQKHFGNDDTRSKLVADAQKEIQRILKDILDEILYAHNFTSEYRDKLEGFTTQLKELKELNKLPDILASIMHVTVDVIQASEQLKEHLGETTSKSEKLQEELDRAQHEILIDPLTSLYNRKAFDKKISAYIKAYHDEGKNFSFVMFDIDCFKKFNDQHGHQMGDQVLMFMGRFLSKELKGKDFVGRYGGEEFFILMEDASLDNACVVADKIRKNLTGVQLKHVKTGQVLGKISISAGVATMKDGDTVESLIKRADDALYMAKQSGRNNVKSELDMPLGHEAGENVTPLAIEFLKSTTGTRR
jgi:diguanylate cyclase